MIVIPDYLIIVERLPFERESALLRVSGYGALEVPDN
jgi:hypothetical protein